MGAMKVWTGSAWETVGGNLAPVVQRVRRTKNANQTIASGGTFTLVTFQNEIENTATNVFSVASGATTILVPGVYRYIMNIAWAADSTGRRGAVFTLNDGGVAPTGAADNVIVDGDVRPASPSGSSKNHFAGSRRFAANDVLRCYVTQQSGVNLDIILDSFGPTEWIIERAGD